MEVILKQDLQPLGFKDDLVEVKPGYGRNYLIPQGIAVLATESVKKVHAENVRQKAKKEEKLVADAKALASKLESLQVKVAAKAGETGKIFGSVGNIQVAEAIAKAGVEVDRKAIKVIGGNPKELGSFEAEVKVYRGVDVTLKFDVVAE